MKLAFLILFFSALRLANLMESAEISTPITLDTFDEQVIENKPDPQ